MLSRYLSLRRVDFSSNGQLLLARNVIVKIHPGANVKISGKVCFGFQLPNSPRLPAKANSILEIRPGAYVELGDGIFIGPGTCIVVGTKGKLTMAGGNMVGNDSLILVKNKVEFGENASTSWSTTLIDADNHDYFGLDGKKKRKFERPLILGRNAGLQANVCIPSGQSIGDNSLVAAGTIVRPNIPANSYALQNPELKIKAGYITGFEIEK